MKSASTQKALTVALARQEFLSRGHLKEGAVAEAIERSWRRCLSNGLDIESPSELVVVTQQELAERKAKNHLLLTHAEPEMLTLSEQIAHTSSLVILTDNEGVILRSMGDAIASDEAQRAALLPGASWSEAHRGTNAIGTALVERSAISVQGAEHFMSYHHALSCSAVPIFGAQSELLATLDVSNDMNAPQQHTLALVKMAAQMIENRLFRASHQADIAIHFHARSEFIGTLWEGTALFSGDGRLVAMNRSGQFQFNLNLQTRNLNTLDMRIEQLFDLPMSSLLNQLTKAESLIFPVRLHSGARLYAKVEQLQHVQASQVHSAKVIKRASAASLDMLNSGDPQVALAIQQIKQVLNRDIPILIQGETGTGKELFARAIHEASTQNDKPWVAVNCAALPEGLIEAELFGYEEGAFTGAKRKGSAGKIEQADGGTLFLDEIGDMPLSLQARLLRVLQERAVTPLGSTKSIPVHFSLISATNQKLKQKVASGEFRSDLYYRLNGLSVYLPALRERTDLAQLIKIILQTEQVSDANIQPQAMQVLAQHPWPGNIRQLHNVMRTALALASGAPIAVEHFTHDFIEEYQSHQAKNMADLTAIAPQKMPAPTALSLQGLKEVADDAIKAAMLQQAGNITAVARQLGISRNTLYRKLRLLGLA